MSEQCKEDMCNNCDGGSVSCSVMKMIKDRLYEMNNMWFMTIPPEKEFLEALVNQIKINKGVTPCPK